VSITSHPSLPGASQYHLDILPSSTLVHQSVTITLPAALFVLQIVPTVTPSIVSRASKIFVTAGMQRLNPMPQPQSQADSRRPLFEMKLSPGVNRIEVEIIAGPMRGAPKVGQGHDVDQEKVTIFAFLQKS
jgi:chromatin structure-remodeling complex subunit RSC4